MFQTTNQLLLEAPNNIWLFKSPQRLLWICLGKINMEVSEFLGVTHNLKSSKIGQFY